MQEAAPDGRTAQHAYDAMSRRLKVDTGSHIVGGEWRPHNGTDTGSRIGEELNNGESNSGTAAAVRGEDHLRVSRAGFVREGVGRNNRE